MNRTMLALALAAGNFAAASAQEWAQERLDRSPRHLEWVKVPHDERTVQCFLAYPEVNKKTTAVVVIHEIFGLTDWVRGVTDQLAEAGYLAIAPDLLSGAGPDGGGTSELGGPDKARQAIAALPQEQVTADLDAVVDYVSKLPACNGDVAVAGFCWGGTQAFRYATHNPTIDGVFVFYGSGPESVEAVARISCPVYGFYGENDARINLTIPATQEAMAQANKAYHVAIYPGAGHGFMRAGEAPDTSEANRAAREAAWKRWKELLESP